jgi:oxygen-dependent protoporphyrinogen oxidase
MADVIVIGAGLAGLAAAQRLLARGVDVQVVEKGPVAGGAVRTVQREGWRHEWGPNSFLASAEALRQLGEDAGVPAVAARPAAKKRYLFIDGKVQSLPANPIAAASSPLLPAADKIRFLAGAFKEGKPQVNDSVREFFEPRIGKEATDRFVDAFVSGIYAGNISEMGMAAAFPKVFDMAVANGSLSKSVVAMLRSPKGKATVRGTFSFAGGLGDLPAGLTKKLGARLQLNADVSLSREGQLWRAGDFTAPTIIVASPAWATAQLVSPFAPELSGRLSEIQYNPIAGVHLLFRRDDIPHALDGFGFLIPRREQVRILGCIWSSALFDVCAPAHFAMTCFVGGAHDPAAMSLSDDHLISQVQTDLKKTMGIRAAAIDSNVVRHAKGIPQYGRTHLQQHAAIRKLTAELPGLVLAGNYFDGISMNDTVVRGQIAADEALALLGTRQERAA